MGDAVDGGIDNARQRHQRRIDHLAQRGPFRRERLRRRQGRQRQIISPRCLGHASIKSRTKAPSRCCAATSL